MSTDMGHLVSAKERLLPLMAHADSDLRDTRGTATAPSLHPPPETFMDYARVHPVAPSTYPSSTVMMVVVST